MVAKPSHLRVAAPDEARPEPKTLVEAAGMDRRAFLVAARKKIASEIDAGVPSHALGRLIAEMDRLDTEVRRIDAADEQEARQHGDTNRQRRSFDASAI